VRWLVIVGGACVLLASCGGGAAAPAKQRRAGVGIGGKIPASLLAGERPIGRGPRFQPPDAGHVIGRCESTLGRRRAAHIEVFAANKVVLLAAGIGTGPRRDFTDGRLTRAGCFGALVTLDPTGTVYFAALAHLTLADVFKAWGQTLTSRRVASFTGGRTTVYVDGIRWRGAPGGVPLRSGAEVVIEIGPHVPPHKRFVFAPQPPASMR